MSLSYWSACALDDNGINCWGEGVTTEVPALINPTFVVTDASPFAEEACALDDTGIVCWGDNSRERTIPPSLINPREIAFSLRQACALDDTGIVCWGEDSSILTNIPNVNNPSNITMGHYHACVIDNGTVICWGSMGSPHEVEAINLLCLIHGMWLLAAIMSAL